MKKLLSILFCLGVPLVAGASGLEDLVITEIMYDLDGSDSGREWVEFMNVSEEAVIITSDNRFYDGNYHTLSGDAFSVPAGSFVIFTADENTWRSEYVDYDGLVIDTVMSLKNSTGTVGLATSTNSTLLTSAMYDSSIGGTGNGFSLEREPGRNIFFESSVRNGTPGYIGSEQIPETEDLEELDHDTIITESEESESEEIEEPSIILDERVHEWSYNVFISELLPNPLGSDNSEWIEIYNGDTIDLDLSGWYVQDGSGKKFTIGAESDELILRTNQYLLLQRGVTGIALNNSGVETVYLFTPDGDHRQTVTYSGPATEQHAWAWFGGQWNWTQLPTPGTQNILDVSAEEQEQPQSYVDEVQERELEDSFIEPAFDALLITEVLANPEGSDSEEWIEIKNNSKEIISLDGWSVSDAFGSIRRHTFEDTVLELGQYYILNRSDSNIVLNNSREEIVLTTPAGREWVRLGIDASPSGQSYAYDEEKDEWVWTKNLTPGEQFVAIKANESEDEPVIVAGTDIITELNLIENFDAGTHVNVSGVVVIEPRIIGKQTLYIAEFYGDAYAPEMLVQVYQYRGDFPEVHAGDIVEIAGEISHAYGKPRIKIASADQIQRIDSIVLEQPEVIDIASLEYLDEGLVTVEGEVVRVNTKSFRLSDSDQEITIKLVDGTLRDIRKGQFVSVSGLYRNDSIMILSEQSIVIQDVVINDENNDAPEVTSLSTEQRIYEVESKEKRDVNPWYVVSIPVLGAGIFGARKYLLPLIK